jgi:hypothetical protein
MNVLLPIDTELFMESVKVDHLEGAEAQAAMAEMLAPEELSLESQS